jgi:hypothetical protein
MTMPSSQNTSWNLPFPDRASATTGIRFFLFPIPDNTWPSKLATHSRMATGRQETGIFQPPADLS